MVSNAAAGASYEYHLIWALAVTLAFRFIWVNTSAKYVLVTGESLITGYGRAGRWVPWLFLGSVVLARCLYMSYSMLLMGDTADLLIPLPFSSSAQIWTCLFTGLGFAMTFWGGYRIVESFCKVLVGLMGGSLIVAAVISRPDPVAIITGTLTPNLPEAEGLYSAVLIILALIGIEVGSTANLNYAYFIREKGWTNIKYLKRQRFDLAVGMATMFLMGALTQIAAAATIHPLGIEPKDANDLARIFSETLGGVGLVVFAFGLWGASFSTFLGGNTGGALIVRDICRNFVPGLKRSVEGETATKDPVYRGDDCLLVVRSPLYRFYGRTTGLVCAGGQSLSGDRHPLAGPGPAEDHQRSRPDGFLQEQLVYQYCHAGAGGGDHLFDLPEWDRVLQHLYQVGPQGSQAVAGPEQHSTSISSLLHPPPPVRS